MFWSAACGISEILSVVRMAMGGEQAPWREVSDQIRDAWSALGQLGGVAAVAFKYADWQSSAARAWLKTSLPATPESYSHLEHPRRDFEQAVVQRVFFYERNRDGFPAVLRIVRLLGGWGSVQNFVRQALAEHIGRSRSAAENKVHVVVAELQKHVSDPMHQSELFAFLRMVLRMSPSLTEPHIW